MQKECTYKINKMGLYPEGLIVRIISLLANRGAYVQVGAINGGGGGACNWGL